MTEEQHGYGTVEAQLKRLETHLQTISTDPAASDWLKRAVVELWERDVLRDLLEESAHGLRALSNAVTRAYFTHVPAAQALGSQRAAQRRD